MIRAKLPKCIIFVFFFLMLSGTAFSAADNPLSGKLIALLPFENLTEDKGSVPEIMHRVREWLENFGYRLVPEAAVEKFLLVHDVRNAGRLPGELIVKVGQELGADYILLGSVNLFAQTSNTALLSLTVRLVSVPDGNVVWGSQSSHTGDDFKGVLGFGKISKVDGLFPVALKELFSSLKQFDPSEFNKSQRGYHVAVLPFENLSSRKDAGLLATFSMISALSRKPGWGAVDYGKVWNVLVTQNYSYRGILDYDTLQALGKSLDVDGIILGAVEKFYDPPVSGRNSVPEVCISLRLLSVQQKAIIWADQIIGNGQDDLIILDYGRIRTSDKLTQISIQKLVRRLPRVEIK